MPHNISPASEVRILEMTRTIDFEVALHNPHNGLNEQIAQDDECSYELVYFLLSKKDRMRLDPNNPPVRVSSRFIGIEGIIREADIVFRCPTRDGGFFYLVVEHKSHPDSVTPMQAIRVKERIWSIEFEGGKRSMGCLTEILFIVLYHGVEEWNIPDTMEGMVDKLSGQTGRRRGTKLYLLVNLLKRRIKSLRNRRFRSALLAFSLCKSETVSQQELRMLAEGIAFDQLGCYLVLYIIQELPVSRKELREALARWSPDGAGMEGFMRTIFDVLREEGREEARQEAREEVRQEALEEGREEGREEGSQESLVNIFLRQAEVKFKSVPKRVETRVRAAPLDQLNNWLLRLISADSLDSVFGAPAKS